MTYTKNNQRYSLSKLKKDNPTISFPKEPSEELLASYGVTVLIEMEKPEYDPLTHQLEESIVDSTQVWTVVPLPEDVANQRKVGEAKRYLEETDWIVTKIAESQVLGADIAELLAKYSVELDQREASRALINNIEENR
jgi:hypothetical protein